MRPYIALITLTFLFCSCSDTAQDKALSADTSKSNINDTKYFDTNRKNDPNTINRNSITLDTLPNISIGKMILVSSGQTYPATIVKIDGCDFDLVKRNNDTTYLATNDKKFQTPEGYEVGTKLSDLPKDMQHVLTKESGWGYYYKLPSGWTLGFCEGNSCTDNYPKVDSKVKWIFKRQ